ncbi:hypothetical protein [Myxococcus xanthus]|uniref:hypothetical protein n=1 Tax=Myxococcus xanthus TaxID=34 RepID=UPI001F3B1A8A|nr:hypothetical protein [Myxococcus xanthus]
MESPLYTGEVRTVGESMARGNTDAGAFKIFMDEPVELGIPVTFAGKATSGA